jgi:hypothetical protein
VDRDHVCGFERPGQAGLLDDIVLRDLGRRHVRVVETNGDVERFEQREQVLPDLTQSDDFRHRSG